MSTTPKFHWHSRVKTGGPENINGDVETMSSHVNDENAHPSYLKKGQTVPSGQALYVMAQHRGNPMSHAQNLVRRGEVMTGSSGNDIKSKYAAVKGTDYANDANNYGKASPMGHLITAYALNHILEDYATKDSLHGGNGKNVIYLDHGDVRVSQESVGDTNLPVYLKNGELTPIDSEPVSTGNTDQNIDGSKTFVKIPSCSVNPTASAHLVNLGFLKDAIKIPVGFCTLTAPADLSTSAEYTADMVASSLGYGTWQKIAEIGNFAYLWLRTE